MPVDINVLKGTFSAETGLDWSANIHSFIQYYQAKILEAMMNQQKEEMEKLLQAVNKINSV